MKLKSLAKRPATLDQNFQKGTAQLIIEPADLVFALTEIAKKQGIDVVTTDSAFAKFSANALADTQYLTRMTKKAELQPVLQ